MANSLFILVERIVNSWQLISACFVGETAVVIWACYRRVGQSTCKGLTIRSTSSGANGFSGAGVGLYLSSPTPADVTVTPNDDYGFSNLVFGPTPSLFSQGGLGITVYLNEDKSPIFLRLVQLWDNRGNIYTGPLVRDDRGNVVRLPDDAGTGTGSIAAAASPPTPGTFRIPLAPILLRLQPGNRYLMWVWCWQRIHSRMDEATYFSALDVRMPAVTVCAGPPIVGPR
jgi:hypothetical protein